MPRKPKAPTAKKAAILAAAERLFSARGFSGVSMDDIAAQAPVSKPTLYTHFHDKAALFSAVIENRCTTLLSQMEQEIGAEEDPQTALTRVGEIYLARILSPESLGLFRVIIAAAADFPGVSESFYGAGPKRMETLIGNYLAAQHKRGRLRVPEPVEAAALFLGLLKGNTHLRHLLYIGDPADRKSVKRTAARAVKLFLAAYRVEK